MTPTRRQALAVLGAAVLAAPAVAAPSSELIDPRWARFGEVQSLDHSAWTAFLTRYRSLDRRGVARLAYGAVTPEDQAALTAYIRALEGVDPTTLTRPAAFAYWANLYNAITVALVLEAYPVYSIKEVRGGLLDLGPWDEQVATVAGATLSLDDIEHGVLRPVFADPRVHYAVNCASVSCPNLLEQAFAAETLEAQLQQAAREYVNHPRGAEVMDGRLVVSSIYEWFKEDFGGDDSGVLAHLRAHAEPELKARLEGVTAIDDDRYFWDLNGAR